MEKSCYSEGEKVNVFDKTHKKLKLLNKTEEENVETWLVNSEKNIKKVCRIYKLDLFNENRLFKLLARIKKSKTLRNDFLIQKEKSIVSNNNIITFFENQLVSISDLLKKNFKNGIRDWNILKNILIPIIKALQYLHSKKIIHNNLTSNSIFITYKNKVKLDYFKHFIKNKEASKKSSAFGNICYLAPELINENLNGYNNKIDIWAFGALVYELVNGTTHLGNFTVYEAVQIIEKEKHPDFSKFEKIFPKKILRLLNRCFLRNPNKRPEFSDFLKIMRTDSENKSRFLIKSKLISKISNTDHFINNNNFFEKCLSI